MEFEITARPGAAVARAKLSKDDTLTAEVGAMVAMSAGLQVETTSAKRGSGSFLRGLKRMVAGENFFLNHFTAQANAQEVVIGPSLPGDVHVHRIEGTALVVQGSSWLASTHGVQIDASWQGFSSALFSGEGMFWVQCRGQGDVLFNSFGAVYEVDVRDSYVVDTGHIVAFEETLSFSISKAGSSWIGSFLGGEGLVCRFSGRGKLYCQTHNPGNFGKLLGPRLRAR